MAVTFPVLWFRMCWKALKAGKKGGCTMTNIFITMINIAIITVLFTVVRQQIGLVNKVWSEKLEDAVMAEDQYRRSCVDHNHTNHLIILECGNLKKLVHAEPLIRAISAVIQSWKTCVSIECSDLAQLVWSSYEYLILCILVIAGIIYYFSKFITIVHEKCVIIQDYYRARDTREYLRMKYGQPRSFEDHILSVKKNSQC